MSAGPGEQRCEPLSLLDTADRIAGLLDGHRVEIIGGQIIVTPPASGPHAESLSDLMLPLMAAGLHAEHSRVLQAIGLWLPGGPSDYAVPDLALVDADYRDHRVEYGCYDPAVFRMVAEVTSTNYQTDLKVKPAAYAGAGIPVYLIVDRNSRRVRVLSDPQGGEYRVHAVHHPGQSFTLPGSVGAVVELEVDALLGPAK
ncbi:Uma2 family endonuclease [Kitasatospora nipponensis]|uniref:Uma2 family endonuclease n=1 Tax=Kitasatospora nipponensis TaxID=258049 RepID=A0ABP4GA91_9ACTN